MLGIDAIRKMLSGSTLVQIFFKKKLRVHLVGDSNQNQNWNHKGLE